jgi:hypothetical protein
MSSLWLSGLLNLFAYILLFMCGIDTWLFPDGNSRTPSDLKDTIDQHTLSIFIAFSYGSMLLTCFASILAWLARQGEESTQTKKRIAALTVIMSACGILYSFYMLGRLHILYLLRSGYPHHH